jgi:hypothetical protein|tara:strand:- start:572 stop:1018 length:447 start_codon:yes stop_codon:yes gene_type:complete
MASTLTPTSFNVKIIEEQVVKNSVIKNEITYTIANVSNVDRRILTCPNTTSIDLFNLNGPNPGAGTFPSSSLQYARITNLDDTYNLALTISGSQGTITQEITPNSTLFIASSNITSSNFNGSFGDDIEYVKAYAISSSIDVEYTLVNS